MRWVLCLTASGCFSTPEFRAGGDAPPGAIDARDSATADSFDCSGVPTPLFHAPFDETTGATTDANGVTGTLHGAAKFRAGHRGNAIDLDGTDDYVDFGTPTGLDNLQMLTVCAWISIDRAPTTEAFVIAGKVAYANPNIGGWKLFVSKDDDAPQLPRVGFAGSYRHLKWGTTDVPVDQWHHACGTWVGGKGANRITVYFDGANDLVGYTNQPGGGPDTDAANPIRVGGGYADSNIEFVGGIDDLMIFSPPLSATEISTLYTCTQ